LLPEKDPHFGCLTPFVLQKKHKLLASNVQPNSADYIYIYSLKKKHAEFFKTLLLNMTNVGIKKCNIYSIMPKKCAMKKQENGKMTTQKILSRAI
jgi:hypothetical protein